MNMTARPWSIGVIVTAGAVAAIIGLNPTPRHGLALVALAAVVLLQLVLGHRSLPRRGSAAALTYCAALIGLTALACYGSPLAAILLVIVFPVLWIVAGSRRVGITLSIATGAAVVVGSWLGGQPLASIIPTAAVAVVFSIMVGLWITAFASYAHERDELLLRLQKSQEQMRALEHQAGQDAERARVSRDIHDTIAQSLTGLVMVAQRARRELPPGNAATAHNLAVLDGLASDALGEARSLVSGYGLPGPDAGLAPALRRLAASFERETGVEVTLDLPRCDLDLTQEREVVLLRCAQESFANIRKHARASRVTVDIGAVSGAVNLRIHDDGVGMGSGVTLPSEGTGVSGMTQRLALAGGTVRVESGPDGGTEVLVSLPVDAGAPA